MFNLDSNTVFYIEKVNKWWDQEISANGRGSRVSCWATCFVSERLHLYL